VGLRDDRERLCITRAALFSLVEFLLISVNVFLQRVVANMMTERVRRILQKGGNFEEIEEAGNEGQEQEAMVKTVKKRGER